jgi:1-acyl-sn-glycerol-3-phosphate acyltransferase
MVTSARQVHAAADAERVLEVVRELAAELGHDSAARSASPASQLERDLGLGSLERVELLLRLEKAFGTRLDEEVLAAAEKVQDLITALSAASGAPVDFGARTEAAASAAARAAQISFPGEGRRERGPSRPPDAQAEGISSAETIQEVLRLRGRTDASRTHLIFYEDEAEGPALTFGELLEGAERVAADLAQRGLGRGDRVALMLPTSPEFFLAFAGTLLAGATPVPIYPPFRADRIAEYAERQSAILANAGARLLITFREAAGVAKLLKPLAPSLEGVARAEELVKSRAAAPLGPQVSSRADDLALLQYTSGSTGNPKGVMLTHANLLASIRAMGEAFGLRRDDIGVSWLPLYHDMGLIGAWLMPLYFGLPMVILSPLAFLSRPARWLHAFHRYRGTMGAAPNFAYELAAAKISDDEIQGVDLSSWRAALNGAEQVHPATLDRFAGRFARCGFRREALLPVYGLAEASLAVTIPPVGRGPRVDRLDRAAFAHEGRAVPAPTDDSASAPTENPNVISFVSVGSPIPRHDVRIVDDRGEDVEERVEGRLWFRGPSATQGYYRNEPETAALFPRSAEAGWVDSGDRAYRADGEIYITGRVKDIIIHAGHHLYPHEIEDTVARVPGVRKGCVVAFGASDPVAGTEQLVIVAESRETNRLARERLAQAISAQVTETLGQPPSVVEVVPPNTIPKTSSGKLRRNTTKERFLGGELSPATSPAWLQIARLAAASSSGRIRSAVRRSAEIVYGCYAILLFAVMLLPTWAFVLLSRSRQSAARITTAVLRGYLRLAGWRVRISGREHLRQNIPRMLVSNHTSYADIVVLMAALGSDYHFVAKAEVMSMPFVRTFMQKLGHFAFRREDPRERLQQAEEIEEALRRGESVFVFPEGTFTAQSGVRPFHLGAFKAAVAAQREIVPIALEGTRQALRDGTWLPRRSQISITICPPIAPPADAADWKEIVRVRDAAREIIARHAREPLL